MSKLFEDASPTIEELATKIELETILNAKVH